MKSLYEQVANLDLVIDRFDTTRYERAVSSDFTRVTTVVALEGEGEVGRGEDVTYDTIEHDEFQADPPVVPSTDVSTLDEFSNTLSDVDLFPHTEPDQSVYLNYRRWALESAALDLALRQANTNLADVLHRSYDPVRFVFSTNLDDPHTGEDVFQWLERIPDLEFKLDVTPEWSDETIQRLSTADVVRILDLKGQYEGTSVDQPADPTLYSRILHHFPASIIEDPALTEETSHLFDGHRSRVGWDYPIRDVATIESLPWSPNWINIKPSRFGSVRNLFTAIEYCLTNGIGMYGGGQFELDVGREHLHTFASMFYPTAPNDVAPSEYNQRDIADELPTSPLSPPERPMGLSWSRE